MTAQEMIDAFLLEYDLNGSGAVAGFTDAEILSFLNKSQLTIAEQVFLKHGADQLYDINKAFVAILVAPAGSYYNQNERSYALPTDYMYYINSSARVTRTTLAPLTDDWIECRPIKSSNSDKFLTNDSNAAIFINPVIFMRAGNVVLIIDSDTTLIQDASDNFTMNYAKIPDTIDISGPVPSDMSEKWHQDIVNEAVRNAMYVTYDVRVRQKNIKVDKEG